MSKTAEGFLKQHTGYTPRKRFEDCDYTWDSVIGWMYDYANESLEAYNRECKRVDELTEEVAKIRGSLIISNNSAKRRGEKIAELEGLLKDIISEVDSADYDGSVSNATFGKIKKAINL